MTIRRFAFLLAALILISGLPGTFAARPAQALTIIIVNDTGDSGTCINPTITLRCAVQTANGSADSTITIAFNVTGTIHIGSQLGLLSSTPKTIQISGNVTLDGGSSTQIIGVASNINAVLQFLTIQHGNATGTG